ncbi:hypothetical protein FRC08_009716 [Ceratobasidium sp. 394]|nr:hypothetical protein FRC08_009716 [Ceratobasidium sp. 394]KAG9077708.1 hypothetical protein FS749_010371 [Ceratobasidium sp. UAMH 11750]
MNDIYDTMGSGIPTPPSQHYSILPVRPPNPARPKQSDGNSATVQAAMSTMQTQLRETQSSLQAHVDKIRTLERLVEEHEATKREVGSMREMLTRARSPLPLQPRIEEGGGDLCQHGGSMLARRRGSEDEYNSDSDVRSVCTITPKAGEEEQRTVGRPKMPEPTGHGVMDDEHHQNVYPDHSTAALHDQNTMLAARLEALTAWLEQAIVMSQGLQTHAAWALSAIAALEAKINALEGEQRVACARRPAPSSWIMKSELMRKIER